MLNACIRCSTLFVGFVSLIQAIIWAGFAIWGIAIYECLAEPVMLQTQVSNYHEAISSYLFYVSYLRGSCRDPVNAYVAPSAERTYKYLLAYSIISSIWVPAVVLLLVGTCLGARGNRAKWIYIPYIIVTLTCCVIDVAATVTYAIDISETTTPGDYFSFTAMTETIQKSLGLIPSFMNGSTVAPAIVMTIIGSRCVILWLLNAFFVAFGLQGLCALSKPSKPKPYNQSPQYLADQTQVKPDEGRWIPFQKEPMPVQNNRALYPDLNNQQHRYDTLPKEQKEYVQSSHSDSGKINKAYVIDAPLRLDPVEVEVKPERSYRIIESRFAEVSEIEMEPSPQELRHTEPTLIAAGSRHPSDLRYIVSELVQFEQPESEELETVYDNRRLSEFNSKLEKLEKMGLIVPVTKPKDFNPNDELSDGRGQESNSGSLTRVLSHVSQAESAFEDENDVLEEVESLPSVQAPTPTEGVSNDTPRRVYDVHGNPTEERLTPKITRLTRIIEKQIAASQNRGDLSGLNNNRPYSYVLPLQPQVESVPKKNDTVRGLEKPPIPVPDYSVRVTRTPSFRTPLPYTD